MLLHFSFTFIEMAVKSQCSVVMGGWAQPIDWQTEWEHWGAMGRVVSVATHCIKFAITQLATIRRQSFHQRIRSICMSLR